MTGESKMYQVCELIVYGGTIRIPVDSKVFMRPVISRQEAEALIDAIPGMHAEACHERNFGQVDARFMKRAETLLYGELSVALGIPFEEVQPYLPSRIASQ